MIMGFIAFLAGVLFYSLGTIDYAIYTGFLALAVALTVVALTEVRFYIQGQKLDSIEQKLEELRKFEEDHHPDHAE